MSLIHKRDQIGFLATGVSTDITDLLRVVNLPVPPFPCFADHDSSYGLHICSLQLISLLC